MYKFHKREHMYLRCCITLLIFMEKVAGQFTFKTENEHLRYNAFSVFLLLFAF